MSHIFNVLSNYAYKDNNGYCSKVTLMEGEDGIHLKNLALHPATNEEEGKYFSVDGASDMMAVHSVFKSFFCDLALNWLFLGDTNRMIAEVRCLLVLCRNSHIGACVCMCVAYH